MSIIALIGTAVGTFLSLGKSRWCFAVWLPANLYWMWFNWPGIQSWVFGIMAWACCAGWLIWGNDEGEYKRLRNENLIFRQGWQAAQDSNIKLKEEIDNLKGCRGS